MYMYVPCLSADIHDMDNVVVLYGFSAKIYMFICYELESLKMNTEVLSKNVERHTAHTIVSWPGPKQWQMGHTSNLILIIR